MKKRRDLLELIALGGGIAMVTTSIAYLVVTIIQNS